MEHFNNNIGFVEPVEDGELTDEYVVNLMHEFGIDFNTSIDYQPSKLYDNQMQDLVRTTQLDAPDSDGRVANHENFLSPAMTINSESLEHSLSSPVGSPYFISLAESPAECVPETKQVNYSPAMPVAVSGYPVMPVNREASGHTLSLPLLSVTSPMAITESPTEVVSKEETPLQKRRGRKPKSEGGKATAPSRQQKQAKRMKVYEIPCPFEDKEKERKRINAVNARKHRVLQKEALKNMEQQLADSTIEKNILSHQKMELQNKVMLLTQQLEAYQKHYGGWQPVQIVTFFPEGQQ